MQPRTCTQRHRVEIARLAQTHALYSFVPPMKVIPAVLAALCAGTCAAAAPVAPSNLQVEFLSTPIGLDQPQPRFSWTVDVDWASVPRGFSPSAYLITVKDVPCAGTGTTVWSSGKVTSNATANIAYAGSPLSSATTYMWTVQYWSTSDSDPSPAVSGTFSTGLLSASDWAGSAWVTGAKSGNQLRTTFSVGGSGSVCSAFAYVAAPGGFSMFVNGEESSTTMGVMEWMQFDVTSIYHTLDIKNQVVLGDNAVGFITGFGVWGHYFQQQSALRAVIRVVASDGTVTVVNTTLPSFSGASEEVAMWLAAAGYITANDPWVGATTDWRLYEAGWATSSFNPAASVQTWTPVVAAPDVPTGKLASLAMPPAQIVDTVTPVSAAKIAENHYVYEFPINLVGIVSVAVPSGVPAGGKLSMKHGEVLFPNGSVSFPWNESEQTDYHIVDGKTDVITPRFVWHGFQFVELVGSDGMTVTGDLSMLTGLIIHTSVPTTGNVSFSGGSNGEGELLSQIQAMTQRGQLNNVAAYMPTDCPTVRVALRV